MPEDLADPHHYKLMGAAHSRTKLPEIRLPHRRFFQRRSILRNPVFVSVIHMRSMSISHGHLRVGGVCLLYALYAVALQ